TANSPSGEASLPDKVSLKELQKKARAESSACAQALRGYVNARQSSFGALTAASIEALNPPDALSASSLGLSIWAAVTTYCETRRRLLEALGKSPDSVTHLFINESNGTPLKEEHITFRADAPFRKLPSATQSQSGRASLGSNTIPGSSTLSANEQL